MNLALLYNFLSYILPIGVLFILLGFTIILTIGMPYCKYIFFLSQPEKDQGLENLAKHLAERARCKGIKNNQDWKCFIPAASSLRKQRHDAS